MVKCSDCGFLAVRMIADGSLVEADDNYRQTGGPYERHGAFNRQPVCFAMAFNLRGEIQQEVMQQTGDEETARQQATYPETQQALRVIVRERECGVFTTWQQGFTPKEHKQMVDEKWKLEFQGEEARKDREWRDQTRREDKRWRIIELIVLGFVAGGFTVLGAFIQRGTFP